MGEDIMDYTDRCRLCIAGAKRLSIDIFSPEGKRSKLQSKISKYLSLKVSEDDKLPSAICYQCLFRLETWVSFKKHCFDSDQTLKNWAFFCGAITPESYLIEANKSSENGSDVEKSTPSYLISNDMEAKKHRTPPTGHKMTPGPSHTPSRTVSPSPSAPLSSSSSTSSHRRGSETHEKSTSSKAENFPLNGVTRPSGIRPSKTGRRKILRPTKAFTTSRNDGSAVQLIAVERQASRKSEDANSQKELPQKETSPMLTLPFKRKRGRPSKAYLRERAEALRKLKEAQAQQEPPEKEEEEELKDFKEEPKQVKEVRESREIKKESIEKEETKEREEPKSKDMTELIELEDPDFGRMKFTLSVIDSSAVPSSEKTLVYPESSSSGRLSADSCLKEEFSGFPNVKAKEDDSPAIIVVETLVEDRLSEPCASEITSLSPVKSDKSDRKRSHPPLGHRSSEESEVKMMKVDETSRSSESLKEKEGIVAAVTALPPPPPSPDQFKTEEDDESDAEVVTATETNIDESFAQDGEQLDEDSDSDNGPPMSPLSPARIHFEVIDVGEVQETENDRSDDFEY